MKLFFGEITNNIVTINDEEQNHIIKVLRMKTGEEIFVTNGNGSLAKGILSIEGKKANFIPNEIQTSLPDFTQKLHVAIAPTKNIDRIEFFVEKATEMAISEITFLNTEKTERKNINIEKLIKQAVAASKQSLRVHFPKINDLTKFSDFVKTIKPENTFVAHCDKNFERTTLNEINLTEKTILVGPEGDFSPKEIQLLLDKNIKAISLGNQRLRTETAGIYIAAWNYNKI